MKLGDIVYTVTEEMESIARFVGAVLSFVVLMVTFPVWIIPFLLYRKFSR